MKVPPDLYLVPSNVDEWAAYIDELYEVYLATLIRPPPVLWKKPVRARYSPPYKDKHFCFWHLISEGKDEEERTPDPRRCERIAWIRWVIDNADDEEVLCWERTVSTPKGERTRWTLWARGYDFAVVVEERKDYILLITAFEVRPHRKRAYEKELGLPPE